ncbi:MULTISPECIES: TIR domain-containing protein [unclassified Blastococcus]
MTKHAFLSFVEEDLDRVRLFRGQAKNKKSDLDFDDYSVKVPYNSQNAEYIKSKITAKIRAASVTICLIGPQTSRSSWVKWEIEKAGALGKKIFGVRLYRDKTCPTPSALTLVRAPVYGWDIDAIVKAIG